MKARVKATGALLEVRLRDIDTEYPYICDMQGEVALQAQEIAHALVGKMKEE